MAARTPRASLLAARDEIAKVVVGQQGVVSGLLAALLVNGHVLVEGVPGVGKTLVVKTLAAALRLDAGRIQCTPDLLPSDITGQVILEEGRRGLTFRPGPIFTNVLLADEINRTPPRTQSALLEGMEERQVTVEGTTHRLPEPFLVVATRNPIEFEGTYPLPEAQLDRFLFSLQVPYPTEDDEEAIVAQHDAGFDPHDLSRVRQVVTAAALGRARAEVDALRVDPEVRKYIVRLGRATRTEPSVLLGVSPRGASMLLHAAKAWAWLAGREFVTPDEVKQVAPAVFRHRILLRPDALIEGATVDAVLNRLLADVPVPR
ncbi:MAG TPA: MoxR family ATPase [Nitriliruptorales bacterium]